MALHHRQEKFSLLIQPELKNQLAEIASQKEIAMCQLIREAIELYLVSMVDKSKSHG